MVIDQAAVVTQDSLIREVASPRVNFDAFLARNRLGKIYVRLSIALQGLFCRSRCSLRTLAVGSNPNLAKEFISFLLCPQ